MKTCHAQLDSPLTDRTITLRLLGFVLASVLVHSALLLSQQPTIEFDATADNTMQITLGEIKPVGSHPQPEPAKQPNHKQKAHTANSAVQKKSSAPTTSSMEQKTTTAAPSDPVKVQQPTQATAQTPQKASSAEATTVAATKAQTSSREQQRITLSQLLKQKLARHFHYPMLARKRGWQGEVRLAFTLDNRGTITNARIAQGSGYSTLDRAALRSLNQVTGIGTQLTQELSFELPVIYSLSGG